MDLAEDRIAVAEDRLHCVGCLLEIGKRIVCPEKERPVICRYAASWVDPAHTRPSEPPQDRRHD